MKVTFAACVAIALSTAVYAQSGRRAKETKVPVPPAAEEVIEPTPIPQQDEAPPATAERGQDYRCTDDGSLARILDPEINERVWSSKQVDSRLVITAKPAPSYTKEARRNGVQGFVTLKLLLSGNGKVSRVRIVRGLPAGLSENAIRAACKLKFKPAMKDGEAVSQWVTVEYVFRLADSSIFGP
jgi:TonB family protein